MGKILNIKNLLLLIQGAIVGTGAILPGISGGVLCVAFGIYEPMMALFSHPKKASSQISLRLSEKAILLKDLQL